ncbi:MAG: L,D-transpeptidase [Proteobacteria bacterium]|nr:L,D-transpeptidase [Pseudomonadota bacterium]
MNNRIVLFFISTLAFAGCRAEPASKEDLKKPIEPMPTTSSDAGTFDREAEPPPPPPEGRPVVAYRDGRDEKMSEPQALAKGLTVVDLSNFWVPFIFSERDSLDTERLPNSFRPVFRKLANDWPYESRTMAAARKLVERRIERARAAKMQALREEGVSEEDIRERLGIEDPQKKDAGDTKDAGDEEFFEGGLGDADNFLEVFGIPPSLAVLRKRALEEIDRECYRDIDPKVIQRFQGFIAYRNKDTAIADARKGRTFALKMRREMERLGIEDPHDLSGRKDAKVSQGLIRIALRYEALVETQKLLACEGLFRPGAETTYRKGGLDWKTHQALLTFEHKNRIFGWGFFGRETLEALGRTPLERLFDAFLRVLAERIADAAGIIEDGSAKSHDKKPTTYKDEKGEEHPVPNLVAEFIAAALRHMDLGTPDKVFAFLKNNDNTAFDQLLVALPLPSLPPYYGKVMDLHVELDRGDVWYDYPFLEDDKRKGQPRKRMPKLKLYVKWNDQKIPLVAMGTTVGGWRSEQAPDGYEYYKYKNSDVGLRVWKDIVAGPVWLPPDTTPVNDLVKEVTYKGRKVTVPNYDEFGPWYASAYGLVAAFHVRRVERKSGRIDYFDHGIRSHGSFDYNSILRRFSHGCHRLYNHLAIRLFDFVLRHREYTRVGQVPAKFSYQFTTDDEETYTMTLNSKGYKYELVNPVPMNVLRGRVRSKQRTPIEHYMPKPGVEYGSDAQFLPEGYAKKSTRDGGTPQQGGESDVKPSD